MRNPLFHLTLFLVVSLNPLLAREIRGLVVGPGGAPVANLAVAWEPASDQATAGTESAETDEFGRFMLRGLPDSDGFLLLKGPEGRGQVRLAAGDEGVLPLIRYPVITEIVILHDNDRHFYNNFPEEVEAFVSAWRQRYPNTFLFNLGDLLVRHRHRWLEPDNVDYYERMGMALAAFMNHLAYDLVVVGNHENAWIEGATQRILQSLNAPLLAANLAVTTDRYIDPLPYLKLTTDNGLRLSVLGLTVGRGEGVEVTPHQEAIDRFAWLRDESDVFILGTHIGINNDRALARENQQFDLLIGGHSHTLLPRGELIGDVLVTQAGGHPHVDGGFIDTTRPMSMGVIHLVLFNQRIVERSARVYFIAGQN
jgi:hypothetical protein